MTSAPTLNRTKMKRPKLTPWYPPEIKPVRAGWYPREGGIECDWWDGIWWQKYDSTYLSPAIFQNLRWRGLAEKP